MSNRIATINLDQPDPTQAINAFLWNMAKARSLGFPPKTEHVLAEHLFRNDVRIVFYSSSGGIISLVQSDESINDEDAFEMVEFIMARRLKRLRERKAAAQGIEAATADETWRGPAEGKSVVAESDALTPAPNQDPPIMDRESVTALPLIIREKGPRV